MTYQVNVGLAGGRLARGQGARIVACGFIGSVLVSIIFVGDSHARGYASELIKKLK
jgi:hypothetical protein